ncbi:MAG TPA: hypothetical protein VMH24_07110 [Candidatus Sulfotelmatobacter sp.]|nr:hypothetical protein [Candidatus Sulfotelmatobacter sp.]
MPATAWLQHVPAIHGAGEPEHLLAVVATAIPLGARRRAEAPVIIDSDVPPVLTTRVLPNGRPVRRRTAA